MQKVGKVLSLCVSNKDTKQRELKEVIALDAQGVLEDKFYNTDLNRSVLLASKHSYEMAKEEGIEVQIGKLGENILMDYNPYSLEEGKKLKIGEVEVEIAQACTLCKSLSKIDNKLPKLLKNDRGIFSKTIKDGNIKVGDEVYLLD